VKKIGITGGIGSGKSTVARVFGLLGVPVYQADYHAKRLMQTHPELIKALTAHFGKDIYSADNTLQTAALSALVFYDEKLLTQLNELVHPFVFNDFNNWCKLNQQQPYILKEAALIYETILHQQLDKIIVVSAPTALKVKRLLKRDNTTESAIQSRMQAQWPEADKLAKADYIIYNDECGLLLPQILKVHAAICA
jgi:dephospho-CoA kinase